MGMRCIDVLQGITLPFPKYDYFLSYAGLQRNDITLLLRRLIDDQQMRC